MMEQAGMKLFAANLLVLSCAFAQVVVSGESLSPYSLLKHVRIIALTSM